MSLKEKAYRLDYARFRWGMTYKQVANWAIDKGWVRDLAEFEQLMLDIEEMEKK